MPSEKCWTRRAARSVAAAAIGRVRGEFVRARLTRSHEPIRSWLGARFHGAGCLRSSLTPQMPAILQLHSGSGPAGPPPEALVTRVEPVTGNPIAAARHEDRPHGDRVAAAAATATEGPLQARAALVMRDDAAANTTGLTGHGSRRSCVRVEIVSPWSASARAEARRELTSQYGVGSRGSLMTM